MVERPASPSRAPVCGYDRHTPSLRMSDWRRVVRDIPLSLRGLRSNALISVARTADEGWWRRLAPRTSGDTRLAHTSRRNTPMTKKNALLVYPAFAPSFWSFTFALHGCDRAIPNLRVG
jgi:hypothetical protein